jgi:hypothetical protein
MDMKRSAGIVAALALSAGASALAPAVALAAPCDSYSQNCPNVKGHHINKPPTVVEGEKQTLPFTGGEIVLMTAAGLGALGAGTAFVVAGRRRRSGTATA